MSRALPQTQPMDGLPDKVTVYEVGPRDGLQNEAATVPTATKAEFIRRIIAAGLQTVETTSFVSPRWVPQLADATDLLADLGEAGRGPLRPVLVPNERGLDRALEAGVGAVAIFGSATETFAHKNLGRSRAESVEMFSPVVRRAQDAGLWVRAYVSMCFGDPWEGPVPVDRVADACAELMDLGCDQLSIGDTIGTGTAGHVEALLEALGQRGIGVDRIGVHFHDTYGQALANILACLDLGVSVVDSAVAGLGGCPYAPGATGNVATEDVVYMLDGMGIETGIALPALAEAGRTISRHLDREPASKVARAMAARRQTAS